MSWSDRSLPGFADPGAAESSGCKYLLSKDFQAGRKFEEVMVVNPFLSGPEDFDFE